MFFAFRIARYAARSGGRGRPARAPLKPTPLGQAAGGLVMIALLIIAGVHWPLFGCILVAFAVVITLVIAVSMSAARPARLSVTRSLTRWPGTKRPVIPTTTGWRPCSATRQGRKAPS